MSIFGTLIILSGCESDVVKTYYYNGDIKEKYRIINGKMEGSYKSYYQNGQVEQLGSFSNGHFHGEWKTYFPNGNIESITIYNNGKLQNRNCWNTNGKQTVIDGNGIDSVFDFSEKPYLKSVTSFKNNTYHGKCENWFPNGLIELEYYFNEGKPIGTWIYWNEKGEVVKTVDYNKDK